LVEPGIYLLTQGLDRMKIKYCLSQNCYVIRRSSFVQILDLLLAFLATLIARDNTSLTELAQRPSGSKNENHDHSFVDTLFSVLASSTGSPTPDLPQLIEAGDIELRKAGLSKKDRSQVPSSYCCIGLRSSQDSSHLFMILLLLNHVYSPRIHL